MEAEPAVPEETELAEFVLEEAEAVHLVKMEPLQLVVTKEELEPLEGLEDHLLAEVRLLQECSVVGHPHMALVELGATGAVVEEATMSLMTWAEAVADQVLPQGMLAVKFLRKQVDTMLPTAVVRSTQLPEDQKAESITTAAVMKEMMV